MSEEDIRQRVRASAGRFILYLPHAIRQMNRPDRMISDDEVVETVLHGEVIEDYPEDVRGHSCLMAANTSEGRTVHIVCAPKEDYLAVITAYLPDPDQWDATLRVRKNQQ